MRRDSWVVSEYSVRPAGPRDECFYCGAKVGTEHNKGCVIRCRTVVLDLTYRICLEVPEDWDEDTVEFCNGGGSSSCADNLWRRIEYCSENGYGCSCGIMTPSFVREATRHDEKMYPVRWEKKHLEESL